MRQLPQRAGIRRRAEAVVWLGLLLGVLGALVLVAVRRPLWFDELFSYSIAGLATPRAVIGALFAGVDNGPPLDYLARHFCMKLLGARPWAFRLPSILALACSLACVWWIGRRSMSRAAAAMALVLPLGGLAFHYATEGRAYAAMLACASLSVLAWLRATERPRSVGRLALLVAALAAGPLCHYYGVLNYVPVLVGEGVRTAKHRRASGPILTSIGLSLLALALLPPFARHALEMKQHFWASEHGWGTLVDAYQRLLGRSLVPALALCALAVLGAAVRARRHHGEGNRQKKSGPPGWQSVAAATLALTPCFVWVAAWAFTNAATDRYGIAAIAGIALLSGQGLLELERLSRPVAWAAVLVVLVGGLATARDAVWASGTAPLSPGLTNFVVASPERIAVDSPLLFLQAFHYLPDPDQRKLVYLTDRAAARRHLGFDNDDIAIPNLRAIVALETEPYGEFVARERQFYVLAQRRRYWLLAQLAADGARIVPLEQFDGIEAFHVAVP